MEFDEQDRSLWDLLGRTAPVKPSDAFVENVVRAVQGESSPSAGAIDQRPLLRPLPLRLLRGHFFSSRKIGLAAAAALTLAASGFLFFLAPTPSTPDQLSSLDEAGWDAPDLELRDVEYLGQLMAVADPGALSDEILADLLF